MTAGLDLQQLRTIPIFAGLPDRDLEALLNLSSRMEMGPEETLFVQGQPSDAFFVVLEGGVDVLVRGANGTEQPVAHMGPGSVLGEISLIIEGNRSATARATEPTRLLRFEDRRFRELLRSGSLPAYRVIHNLAHVLATRLRAADAQIAKMCEEESASTVAEDDLDRLRRIFFTEWGS